MCEIHNLNNTTHSYLIYVNFFHFFAESVRKVRSFQFWQPLFRRYKNSLRKCCRTTVVTTVPLRPTTPNQSTLPKQPDLTTQKINLEREKVRAQPDSNSSLLQSERAC